MVFARVGKGFVLRFNTFDSSSKHLISSGYRGFLDMMGLTMAVEILALGVPVNSDSRI